MHGRDGSADVGSEGLPVLKDGGMSDVDARERAWSRRGCCHRCPRSACVEMPGALAGCAQQRRRPVIARFMFFAGISPILSILFFRVLLFSFMTAKLNFERYRRRAWALPRAILRGVSMIICPDRVHRPCVGACIHTILQRAARHQMPLPAQAQQHCTHPLIETRVASGGMEEEVVVSIRPPSAAPAAAHGPVDAAPRG